MTLIQPFDPRSERARDTAYLRERLQSRRSFGLCASSDGVVQRFYAMSGCVHTTRTCAIFPKRIAFTICAAGSSQITHARTRRCFRACIPLVLIECR